MEKLWNRSGIPHKGWQCADVIDLRDDDSEAEDTTAHYGVCQMCGHENIRYAHMMQHGEYPGELLVGCDCVGRMTEDYEGARARENRVRNRSLRKADWLKRNLTAPGAPVRTRHNEKQCLAYSMSSGRLPKKTMKSGQGERPIMLPDYRVSADDSHPGWLNDICEH